MRVLGRCRRASVAAVRERLCVSGEGGAIDRRGRRGLQRRPAHLCVGPPQRAAWPHDARVPAFRRKRRQCGAPLSHSCVPRGPQATSGLHVRPALGGAACKPGGGGVQEVQAAATTTAWRDTAAEVQAALDKASSVSNAAPEAPRARAEWQSQGLPMYDGHTESEYLFARTCCNALLIAYKLAEPVQCQRALALLTAITQCACRPLPCVHACACEKLLTAYRRRITPGHVCPAWLPLAHTLCRRAAHVQGDLACSAVVALRAGGAACRPRCRSWRPSLLHELAVQRPLNQASRACAAIGDSTAAAHPLHACV